MNFIFGLTLLGGLLGLASAQSNSSNTYTNPIVPTGADPWMTRYGGYYYLIYTTTENITLWRSQELTDWSNAEMKAAFLPPVSTGKIVLVPDSNIDVGESAILNRPLGA